jgi:hypothetical protein
MPIAYIHNVRYPPIADIQCLSHLCAVAEQEPVRTLGQRYRILVALGLVAGLGFLSGIFVGPSDNPLLSGLICGFGAVSLFLLLTAVPAFIVTAVQSIRGSSCREPFGRRFMKNLDATMEFLFQGWWS